MANYLTDTLAETASEVLHLRVLSHTEHTVCVMCHGRRLTPDALRVTYAGMPIDEISALPLDELHKLVSRLDAQARARREKGGESNRDEAQRLQLLSQLSSGLFEVSYVLDEPSAGLHPKEREAVAALMRRLIEASNSVLLVEHDMSVAAQADRVIGVGPGAGARGGRIVADGTPGSGGGRRAHADRTGAGHLGFACRGPVSAPASGCGCPRGVR